MTKVGGETIQVARSFEYGAKYIAEDGKEFDSQWECEHYEAKLQREREWKKCVELHKDICSKEYISIDNYYHIYEVESSEKLIDILNTLTYDSEVYFNGEYFVRNKKRIVEEISKRNYSFPTKLLIEYEEDEYSDKYKIFTLDEKKKQIEGWFNKINSI